MFRSSSETSSTPAAQQATPLDKQTSQLEVLKSIYERNVFLQEQERIQAFHGTSNEEEGKEKQNVPEGQPDYSSIVAGHFTVK